MLAPAWTWATGPSADSMHTLGVGLRVVGMLDCLQYSSYFTPISEYSSHAALAIKTAAAKNDTLKILMATSEIGKSWRDAGIVRRLLCAYRVFMSPAFAQ